MNYKLSIWAVLLISPMILVLSSCGKDKDMDDFRNEQLQADLAEYKEVEGSYTGYLISKEKKDINLGALKIKLAATTQTADSNDGRAMARPVLRAEINYRGTYEASIVGKNSVYNPNTGHFHTEIEVPIVNEAGRDVNETVIIEGAISDGTLTGTMYVASASSSGGEFELRQDNGSLQDLSAQRKPDIISGREPVQRIYSGIALVPRAGEEQLHKRNVQLNIQQTVRTKDDEIYYVLKPITETNLVVNLNLMANLAGATFANTIWNNAGGTLRGNTVLAGPSGLATGILTLSCNGFHFEEKNYNFTCVFTSSLGGQTIRMTFSDKTKTNSSK